MTGPEHYQHAEQLLDWAADNECGSDIERYHLAAAQVHATLALAAATAVPRSGDMPIPDADAWTDAASAYKPPVKLNGGQS